MTGYYAQDGDKQQRVVLQRACPGAPNRSPPELYLSEWCVRARLSKNDDREMRLFGVTEDVCCQSKVAASQHAYENQNTPVCRRVCDHCQVPVCQRCRVGLMSYTRDSTSGTIPMALANDNYNGYALKLLVEKRIT